MWYGILYGVPRPLLRLASAALSLFDPSSGSLLLRTAETSVLSVLKTVVCGLVVAVLLGGCAGLMGSRVPLMGSDLARAQLPGFVGVRFWGDEVPDDLVAEARRQFPNIPTIGASASRIDGRPVIEVLALSGGGPNGAFGAGVLAGWSETGRRPEFEVVTGVSAGALIAPFAFLGPEFDDTLKEIWTTYETKQLIRSNGLPGILGGDSAVDTTPLAELIAGYLNRAVLDKIAAQYDRGRLLLVATTNLDAQRPVVWNMGELARSQRPGAAQLFHQIILASAAIPGVFPPVRIQVEVDGKLYDELHVDGGVTRQMFVSPLQAPIRDFDRFYPRKPIRRYYVIENGKPTPIYKAVDQKTLPIVGRSIQTLLQNQTSGGLYRIYRRVRDAGAAFNFLSIPPTFPYEPVEAFDPKYQAKLFDAGAELGRRRDPWLKQPPDLVPSSRRTPPAETRPARRDVKPSLFGASNFFSSIASN